MDADICMSTLPWDILGTQKKQFWLISCFHRDAIMFLFCEIGCSYDGVARPYDVVLPNLHYRVTSSLHRIAFV